MKGGPPLLLTLIGLVGNSAVFAVLFFRGDPWWPLFFLAIIINIFAAIAAKTTAVRTAESEQDQCPGPSTR